MIGTVRGEEDQKIVDDLRTMAKDLKIERNVEFKINQPRDVLFEEFQKSKVAIHTMKDEHFGIAVVELMASGIITVAHNSAGPRDDIIGPSPKQVGCLAHSEEDYAQMTKEALLGFDS